MQKVAELQHLLKFYFACKSLNRRTPFFTLH